MRRIKAIERGILSKLFLVYISCAITGDAIDVESAASNQVVSVTQDMFVQVTEDSCGTEYNLHEGHTLTVRFNGNGFQKPNCLIIVRGCSQQTEVCIKDQALISPGQCDDMFDYYSEKSRHDRFFPHRGHFACYARDYYCELKAVYGIFFRRPKTSFYDRYYEDKPLVFQFKSEPANSEEEYYCWSIWTRKDEDLASKIQNKPKTFDDDDTGFVPLVNWSIFGPIIGVAGVLTLCFICCVWYGCVTGIKEDNNAPPTGENQSEPVEADEDCREQYPLRDLEPRSEQRLLDHIPQGETVTDYSQEPVSIQGELAGYQLPQLQYHTEGESQGTTMMPHRGGHDAHFAAAQGYSMQQGSEKDKSAPPPSYDEVCFSHKDQQWKHMANL